MGIKYIEIPFCGDTLKTTVKKWLKQGIRSRYESIKVDRQVILRLNEINLSESDSMHSISSNSQLNLFGRA